MTIRRQVSMWRSALIAIALFAHGPALAQTCNPNTASSFALWSDEGATITDLTTGIVWQRCAMGQAWTGSSCSGTASTATWAAAVSGAPTGWRLPNVKELESMVERRCSQPAVNGAAFPTAPDVQFWSSTPSWAVNFSDGSVLSGQSASDSKAVRYVQGGNASAAFDAGPRVSTNCNPNVAADRALTQLVVNADSTVTDQSTGLTWRRCVEGMSFSGGRCAPADTYDMLNWADASSLSAQASNAAAGWRVPNVKELESLVSRNCASRAVESRRFPDQPSAEMWSSTPGWSVNFSDGSVLSGQSLTATKAVRMVKNGATTAAFSTGSQGAGSCNTQAPSDFRLIEWLENADGTLYDGGTGMTWDRCVIGQSWSPAAGACTGTPQLLTWGPALQRANAAFFGGRGGWRLPNVKELESIVDRRCSNPALSPDLFRGNRETMTWSSTPGWAVNMTDGSVLSGQTASTEMAVRLVRGGSGAAATDMRLSGVPGALLAGPNQVKADFVSPTLLLPTTANQKLIFLTHGWNSNSVDGPAWPLVSAQAICARLGATVSSAGGATAAQVGVSAFCETAAWRVVAFN